MNHKCDFRLLRVLIFICIPFVHFAQVPDESNLVFSDKSVARVDITINPAALVWMYNNTASDSEHVAIFRFRNPVIDKTLDSVGFRLRGMTSRASQKKSFKVDFNTYKKGRRFYDLKDLNLNGEHNDISIIRSKLAGDLMNSVGLKASRTAHSEVYINGKYYGLYISVEEQDELMLQRRYKNASGNLWKCIYPADLKYLGENASSYRNIMNGSTPAYDLKTNTTVNDFGGLIRLARMMTNTSNSNLRDSIEKFVDAPSVLKYAALSVLTGGWDSYWSLMNNYFLYLDPSVNKIFIHPYDLDNTFGVSWSANDWANVNIYSWPKVAAGSRPLIEKLLANNYYRNMYSHFISFFANNVMTLPLLESRIDSIKNMISPFAQVDSFRTLDYGFSYSAFLNSYSAGSFANQHIKNGLKQFITLRSASVNSQVNYQDAQPLLYNASVIPQNPKSTDSITFEIAAFSPLALSSVTLKVTPAGGTTLFYPLGSARNLTSKIPEDYYKYKVTIPPSGGSVLSCVITATDVQNRVNNFPNTGALVVKPQGIFSPLFINEICAENLSFPDPSGELDDWIELYNAGTTPVSLFGLFLSDDPTNLKKWKFIQDTAIIPAQGRMLIWCDENRTQPGYHTNFKLSKSGEFISLYDSVSGTVIDSFAFGAQLTGTSFGRLTDGGAQLGVLTPTPLAPNLISEIRETLLPIKKNLIVFPNPASESITVQNLPAELQSVTLYSASGERIFTNNYDGQYTQLTLNLSGYSSGIYILSVKGRTETLQTKIAVFPTLKEDSK